MRKERNKRGLEGWVGDGMCGEEKGSGVEEGGEFEDELLQTGVLQQVAASRHRRMARRKHLGVFAACDSPEERHAS